MALEKKVLITNKETGEEKIITLDFKSEKEYIKNINDMLITLSHCYGTMIDNRVILIKKCING